MSQVSKLVWRRDETPEELFDLLDTLGEEYPVVDGGRGLKLKFRLDAAEFQLEAASRRKERFRG